MRDADCDVPQSTNAAEPPRLIAADVDSTIAEAARLMRDNNVGCVIVTDDGGKLCGIISERDIVNRVVAASGDPESVGVRETMTKDVASVEPNAPMDHIKKQMAERKIRHLPIIADGRAIGMISSRDVIDEQLEAARITREAAEEIAKLAKSFKMRDLNDLLDVVVREVPKVFKAHRAMVYVQPPEGDDEAGATVANHRCPCTDPEQRMHADMPDLAGQRDILCHDVPPSCAEFCGASKAVMISLEINGFSASGTDAKASQQSYLCMCGVDETVAASTDLIFYEGTLVREILCGVLSNAQMYKDAHDSYMIDPLTGVGTRRLFDEKLAAECLRATRYDRAFCLAIIDMDHFKTINDELGHDVGDVALKAVAQTIADQKRLTDVVARYGGDEFVLLMPETTLDNAMLVMERLRERIALIPLPGGGFTITLSCGLAEQMGGRQESERDLFRRADLALFEAKRAGRDCTRSWKDVSDRMGYDDCLTSDTVLDLQQQVTDLSVQSKDMFAESLWGLVRAIEARDPFTKSHSVHVMHYAVAIAETMSLDADDVNVIRRAAMIHDIGMIGVADGLLRERHALSDEQRALIEQHPRIGVHILQQMRALEREVPIVHYHHERWDGQGYPGGISGTRIPREARILSVADAFDAITSNRSHRRSRSVAQALDIITAGAKSQFDPAPVDALVQWVDMMGERAGKGRTITAQELLDALEALEAVA